MIVIDPGADVAQICDHMQADAKSVSMYFLTHGHADHCSVLADVVQTFPAEYGMHADDRAWAFSPANQIPPYYPAPREPETGFIALADGQILTPGGVEIRCMATPGHSPGGMCYYIPALNAVFTGDTLFRETVGRTDLPGASSRTLTASLKKLAALPPDIEVYPGHGEPSTIAHELEYNPYFKLDRA